MSDGIHLWGSEDVQRAGHAMSRAASEMSAAAATISESFRLHEIHMAGWLAELREIMADSERGGK